MSAGSYPSLLRHFLAQLDELRSGPLPDMGAVGRLLVELAADEEYFAPLIAQMPAESPGVHWLARPARGPRLVLVHRPEGVMAYTHSHQCWGRDRPGPDDVHNHGHVAGTGPSPYSLILLGDDMLLFDRQEYDPELGTWRALPPVTQTGRTADQASRRRALPISMAAHAPGGGVRW